MYPKPLQKVIELFTRFPGIGPRQAARFALFLTTSDRALLQELVAALKDANEKISRCGLCYRAMEIMAPEHTHCEYCLSNRRDTHMIAIVERETDMQNMERTSSFTGLYHVLHGVVSPLDQESPKRLHLVELYRRIQGLVSSGNEAGDTAHPVEVVLATNSTAEGDTTARYIERVLAPLKEKHPNLTITRLGRGLSLGAELEYADEITLKTAFQNRK